MVLSYPYSLVQFCPDLSRIEFLVFCETLGENGPSLQHVVSISANVASNNTLAVNVNHTGCLNPFVSFVALDNDLFFCQCNTHAIKQVPRTTQIIK